MGMIDNAAIESLGRFLDLTAYRASLIAQNMSNVDTPRFSRQRPVMVENDPIWDGNLLIGSGVTLKGLEGLRDNVLELRLDEETQQQGQLSASVNAMQQVQTMFSGNDGEIGDAISKFFTSLDKLSTDPTSISMRQGVLQAADNLATAFRRTSANLGALRGNLDLGVEQAVNEVNRLTGQIAQLNGQITSLEGTGQDSGAFLDQRNLLIRDLASVIDVSVIDSGHGSVSLTTNQGTALVADTAAFALETRLGTDGMEHVFAQGADITATIAGGQLAGLLQMRDRTVVALLGDLDTLASGLITSLNTAHHQGYDLAGNQGGDLFTPTAPGTSAAATFSLQITDPSLLAASSDQSPGSNGNLAILSAVATQPVAGGQTPTNFYARVVFQVGSDVSNSSAELDASGVILQQLQNQRAAISGVSLDEEATNLLRYQRAYQASARVITTINELTSVVINLGRY
jgi:flagellar hook-associated protein 1 FlgK